MNRKPGLFHIVLLGGAVSLSAALIVFGLVRMPRNPAPPEEVIAPFELLGETERTAKFAATETTAAEPIAAGGNPFFAEVERSFTIPTEGVVSLDDETFSAAYDELYDRRGAYYGREIELSGYVMAQDGLEPGGFLIGRNLLWCCSSDNYFIGFLAFADGDAPSEGACVRLRGTIEAAAYTNPENGKVFDVPAIRVASLATTTDVSPMVYPY